MQGGVRLYITSHHITIDCNEGVLEFWVADISGLADDCCDVVLPRAYRDSVWRRDVVKLTVMVVWMLAGGCGCGRTGT